jgi:hypothetical protein
VTLRTAQKGPRVRVGQTVPRRGRVVVVAHLGRIEKDKGVGIIAVLGLVSSKDTSLTWLRPEARVQGVQQSRAGGHTAVGCPVPTCVEAAPPVVIFLYIYMYA